MFILPVATDHPGNTPIAALNAGPVGTTDYPWTMFHYDAQRAGVTPASGPALPRLMWNYTTGSLVYPSAAVVDGYVFIPSYDGSVYALDNLMDFSARQLRQSRSIRDAFAFRAIRNSRKPN